MYERILVPLDGSSIAAKALEQAEALAEKIGASLILVRVIHTLNELSQTATPSVATQPAISQDVIARTAGDRERAEARSYIANEKEALQRRGLNVETHVGEGRPADQIIHTAQIAKAGLIVMTAYGAGGAHTRSEKNVFGGVADEVLRQSQVPVLMIRP